jgi:DNA-binding winged helix-turn-helix (wHTH) protein
LIYNFGKFSIDTERLEFRGSDGPLAVEPQVFSLLVYLIENRDRVVSKDELFDHVWLGRIVSDATLRACPERG